MRSSFIKSSSPNPTSQKNLISSKTLASPRFHKRQMNSNVISPNTARARSPKARSPTRQGSPTCPRQSAFNRITSRTLLSQLALPGFLRVNQAEIKKFTALDFLRLGTSDSTINESHMSNRAKLSILEYSKTNLSCYNDISQLVFDRNLPNDEILISVGKMILRREDLLCMQKGTDVNERVVDIALKLIQRKNKNMIKKGKVKKKIFCLCSQLSSLLFKKHAQVPQFYQKNLLEYDYLIFPVRFSYWILVVLEVKTKVIKIFDPIGITDESQLILSQVSLFIANQLRVFQKLDIDKTRWANIQIEKVNETEVFPDFDCGIYLFRRVHTYALQQNKVIHPESLPAHRKSMMDYMFKHSN